MCPSFKIDWKRYSMNGGAGEMLLQTATVFSCYSRGGPEVTREFDTILSPPSSLQRIIYTPIDRRRIKDFFFFFLPKKWDEARQTFDKLHAGAKSPGGYMCAPAFAGVTYALSAFRDYGSQPRSNQVISLASLFHLHILLVIIYLGSGWGKELICLWGSSGSRFFFRSWFSGG